MKRLVLIVDSLRYDYVPFLNLKEKWWCLPTISYAYGTAPAFKNIKKEMDRFQGDKILYTAGHPELLKWGGVQIRNESLFSFIDQQDKILDDMQKAEDDTLIVVHDFWVHNYWCDACPENRPCNWWKEKPDVKKLKEAYQKRTEIMGNQINRFREDLVENLFDWEFYITADHSELFWEDGEHYGHGPASGDIPDVRMIPLIGLNGVPVITYGQLFYDKDPILR